MQDVIAHAGEALGVSAPDAATYMHLCVSGPSKVSEVADALHVHRNDVYRSLDRLTARGLVSTTLEKPARYIATDPREFLDVELSARLAALDELKDARERATSLLEELQATESSPEKATYRVVQGRQEIGRERRRMLAEARDEILFMSTFPHTLVLGEFDGTTDALLARKDDGPAARFLLSIPPAVQKHLDTLLAHPRLEARRFDEPQDVRFLLVDDRELLLNVVNDSGHSLYAPSEVALLTSARGLVDAERLFFEQSWAQGTPVRNTVAGGGS
jgi:hypothetical protein